MAVPIMIYHDFSSLVIFGNSRFLLSWLLAKHILSKIDVVRFHHFCHLLSSEADIYLP